MWLNLAPFPAYGFLLPSNFDISQCPNEEALSDFENGHDITSFFCLISPRMHARRAVYESGRGIPRPTNANRTRKVTISDDTDFTTWVNRSKRLKYWPKRPILFTKHLTRLSYSCMSYQAIIRYNYFVIFSKHRLHFEYSPRIRGNSSC